MIYSWELQILQLRTHSKRELRHLLKTKPLYPFQLLCRPVKLSFSCWVVGTCKCGPKGDSKCLSLCHGCDDKERSGGSCGDKCVMGIRVRGGGHVSGQAGGWVGDWKLWNKGRNDWIWWTRCQCSYHFHWLLQSWKYFGDTYCPTI